MRNKFIISAFIILINIQAMAQNVLQLNKYGIGNIQLGKTVSEYNNFLPINKYSKNRKVFGNFEKYKYYFLAEDSLEIMDLGVIKDIVVVVGDDCLIQTIFIYFTGDSSISSFDMKLDGIFGKKALIGNASIESTPTNTHYLWDVDKNTIARMTRRFDKLDGIHYSVDFELYTKPLKGNRDQMSLIFVDSD